MSIFRGLWRGGGLAEALVPSGVHFGVILASVSCSPVRSLGASFDDSTQDGLPEDRVPAMLAPQDVFGAIGRRGSHNYT